MKELNDIEVTCVSGGTLSGMIVGAGGRAAPGVPRPAAEARWIERALRAIAVRHRDPPLAARHARRAGARLAAAGEWRLAAILTDLAWLLRAYSQSVSSDGAQHGEKTS